MEFTGRRGASGGWGGGGGHAGSSVSSELVMSRIKNGVQICDRVILS